MREMLLHTKKPPPTWERFFVVKLEQVHEKLDAQEAVC